MDKVYTPHEIERRIYERWESNGWFSAGKVAPEGPAYSIAIPPPNVTGTLHMGHAFQHTLMDMLTRYHRMRGYDTLWQPGTDHAGIATQMVVERQLSAKGIKRTDLPRDEFVKRVWEWKAQSGGTINSQMRRLGDSVDWSRDRFTMDEGLSKAVIETFVRLHDEGLIYRGKRLVNWDPVLLTALSDLEVQAEEADGSLWHLRYPLANGPIDGIDHIVVATTRPETDARRHGRRREPGRRALHEAHRQADPPAADGSADPDHRRQLRRPRLRLGLREDHARARLQRLRHRPASQPADDQRVHAARAAERRGARALPRARSLRSAQAHPERASRTRACSITSTSTSSSCRRAIAAAPCSSRISRTSGT